MQVEGTDVRRSGINELPVNFIAEQEQVVLLDYVAELLHLGAGVQVSRGIVGIADKNSLGPRRYLLFKRLNRRQPEAVFDRCLDRLDNCACGYGKCHVIGIERIGDDYLVAGVQAAHKGKQHGLGASGGDNYFIGTQINSILGIIADHLGPERKVAVGGTVLQNAAIQVVQDIQRTIGGLYVGLADIQMIHVNAVAFGRLGIGGELADGRARHIYRSFTEFHNRYLMLKRIPKDPAMQRGRSSPASA